MNQLPKHVSVVVPVFNEEGNIPNLMARFDELKRSNASYRFEFIVVDDGSLDQTSELGRRHVLDRTDLTLVELSRNFGSHYAVSAGLAHAGGDCVIVMSGDLQEPPDLVSSYLAKWEDGFDIVWGTRSRRADQSAFGRAVSSIFSRLLNRWSDLKSYPVEGPSGFLCSRQVANIVRDLPERNRNVLGLVAWSGFHQTAIEYEQRERTSGSTGWNRAKKLKLAIDSLVQFSVMPIRVMIYSGLAMAGLGLLYALLLIVQRLIDSTAPEGWTTVVVVVLMIGGFQLLMLGVLGEYLWRNVDEARGRPIYVVRAVRSPGEDSTSADPGSLGGAHHTASLGDEPPS